MKKKLYICLFILAFASVLFVMELTRGSQQDVSIHKDYTIDHMVEK